MRLVINYQPLNHFLVDDKFPLPKREILFQKLPQAKLFSKFDLKDVFWHLGIHPDDRTKTGFCIPDRHYKMDSLSLRLETSTFVISKCDDSYIRANHG